MDSPLTLKQVQKRAYRLGWYNWGSERIWPRGQILHLMFASKVAFHCRFDMFLQGPLHIKWDINGQAVNDAGLLSLLFHD